MAESMPARRMGIGRGKRPIQPTPISSPLQTEILVSPNGERLVALKDMNIQITISNKSCDKAADKTESCIVPVAVSDTIAIGQIASLKKQDNFETGRTSKSAVGTELKENGETTMRVSSSEQALDDEIIVDWRRNKRVLRLSNSPQPLTDLDDIRREFMKRKQPPAPSRENVAPRITKNPANTAKFFSREKVQDCIRKKRKVPIGIWKSFLVTHVDYEGPETIDVWISDVDGQTDIVHACLQTATYTPNPNLVKGGAAIAMFGGKYRRVVVENISSFNVDVIDVDSGESSTLSSREIFCLPMVLKIIEPLAVKVRIDPRGIVDPELLRCALVQAKTSQAPVSACLIQWSLLPTCVFRVPGCRPLCIEEMPMPQSLRQQHSEETRDIEQKLYKDLPAIKLPPPGHAFTDCVVTHVEGSTIYATWEELQNYGPSTEVEDAPFTCAVNNMCLTFTEDSEIQKRCCILSVDHEADTAKVRWVDCGKVFNVPRENLFPLPASERHIATCVRFKMYNSQPSDFRNQEYVDLFLYLKSLKIILLDDVPRVLVFSEKCVELRPQNLPLFKKTIVEVKNTLGVRHVPNISKPTNEPVAEKAKLRDTDSMNEGSAIEHNESHQPTENYQSVAKDQSLEESVTVEEPQAVKEPQAIEEPQVVEESQTVAESQAIQGPPTIATMQAAEEKAQSYHEQVESTTEAQANEPEKNHKEAPQQEEESKEKNTGPQEVVVTSVTSFKEIWVIPQSEVAKLKDIESRLSNITLEPLTNCFLGAPCVALVSGQLHRATFSVAFGKRYFVHLTDRARDASVMKLYKLPKEFADIPSVSYSVTLCDQQIQGAHFGRFIDEMKRFPRVQLWPVPTENKAELKQKVFITTMDNEDIIVAYKIRESSIY